MWRPFIIHGSDSVLYAAKRISVEVTVAHNSQMGYVFKVIRLLQPAQPPRQLSSASVLDDFQLSRCESLTRFSCKMLYEGVKEDFVIFSFYQQ